jgi:hypothetical protein
MCYISLQNVNLYGQYCVVYIGVMFYTDDEDVYNDDYDDDDDDDDNCVYTACIDPIDLSLLVSVNYLYAISQNR